MSSLIPSSADAPLLIHGDCLDEIRTLPDASVDVVVSDPPAGIGMMGKPWDSYRDYKPRTERGHEVLQGLDLLGGMPRWAAGFVAFMVEVWVEVDRVLKPGGFVCAWALPKTADLAGLAMRLVGWSIHDSLLHLFGGGFPKSLNISKALDKKAGAEREVVGTRTTEGGRGGTAGLSGAIGSMSRDIDITAPATEAAMRWDGWHTQLAPGHEQWLLARKPTPLTYADNVTTHGCGGLHVDACRIPRGDGHHSGRSSPGSGSGRSSERTYGDGLGGIVAAENPGGSWPRNVFITPGGEHCPVVGIDRQSGVLGAGHTPRRPSSDAIFGQLHDTRGDIGCNNGHGDSGGASRYFTRFEDRVRYCAKASDRRAGLRTDIANEHPTHKHPELMRWLVRLLAATAEHTGGKPAVVLDPFMGSGTTGVACIAERVRFVGIERDPGHFAVARSRIANAVGSPEAAAEANETAPVGAQMGLL